MENEKKKSDSLTKRKIETEEKETMIYLTTSLSFST